MMKLVAKVDYKQVYYISTWSYENRDGKHYFFTNFTQLSLSGIWFTVLIDDMVFFPFACFVVKELCRSGLGQNYFLTTSPPPYYFLSLPTVLSLIQVTVV